jgi:hypothetical protein
VLLALLLLSSVADLQASGPRFVTGPPFFTGAPGRPIGWRQTTLLYSTDPGGLGPSVDHNAADALVAAAAGVWNLPVASISVAQGVPLAEHVSGQNTYLSSSGLVWPDDVDSSNAAAVPVAIIYDTDGSVTDTFLGSGASAPGGCRQNAVTESVDAFDPAGYILHAIIVINGRCSGPAPEQQMQLRYQLERVFGRILGLAWSQVNDNVFTGTPTPTADQAAHWPIMHPLDILCGPYSYQCLPSPFTLRPDDIAGLVGLYPNANSMSLAAGKQFSFATAHPIGGFVTFSAGEGMAGVNLIVHRPARYSPATEDWIQTAAVTGTTSRRAGKSPFVTAGTDAWASFGASSNPNEGDCLIPYLEIMGPYDTQVEILSTEAINPLYIGSASVGPYAAGMVSPGGSLPAAQVGVDAPIYSFISDFVFSDAPTYCGNGLDGTSGLPAQLPATGWWNGLICGYGHAAYFAQAIKPGNSLTVEITALDANGFATTSKLMRAIGLFAPTDAPGSLPSLAVAPTAFNSSGVGTTVLHAMPFAPGSEAGTVTVGIADQRGDGRPDFPYQARFFYADNVLPAVLAPSGGAAVLTGMGFRAGNTVSVNGIPVTVTSWTATTLSLSIPSMVTAGASSGVPVDVVVNDAGTGATSRMIGALTYSTSGASTGGLKLISSPASPAFVGAAATNPFSLQVVAADGTTPVVGALVTLSVVQGTGRFSACGASTCTLTADATGTVSSQVTPAAAGAITLQAVTASSSVVESFEAVLQPVRMTVQNTPGTPATVGVVDSGKFQVQVAAADGSGIAGELVTFSVTQGAATFAGCNASPCSVSTNRYGQALVQVTPTAPGPLTLVATDGGLSQSVSLVAVLDTPQLRVLTGPNTTGYVNESLGWVRIQVLHSDGVTTIPTALVRFSGPPSMIWAASGQNQCTILADGTGVAATFPIPRAAGTYVMTASYEGVAVSFTTTVTTRQASLTILSAPSGTLPTGVLATVPFSVQLLDDHGNPVANATVNIGGAQGKVTASCGSGNCIMQSDSNGIVSTPITPLAPGLIVLNATWASLNASASFTASGSPATFKLIRQPAPTVIAGQQQTFQYLTLAPDGVSPMPWVYVFVIVQQGTLALNVCPSLSCRPNTDGNGILTMTATPWVPGPVSVTAIADGQSITANFTVLPNVQAVSPGEPQTFLAEGARFSFQEDVTATQNGAFTAGLPLAWTGSAGLAVSVASTTTSAAGTSSNQITAGPLGGGATAGGQACAWTNICGQFEAIGVGASSQSITIVSGGGQQVSGGTALLPIVARVTDPSGHPVAGAAVTVGQKVYAYAGPCPAFGRCPAEPLLTSGSSTLTTDFSGQISVVPLSIAARATATALEFSVGTQGFATAEAVTTP